MSETACAEITQQADPMRFLATMSCPPPRRAVLWPLFAFNAEVSRAAWGASEPMLAAIRLAWWREALDEIGQGRARAHPVVEALAGLMARTDITPALLQPIIEAKTREAERQPFADEADLTAHLGASAGNLTWAAAIGFGAPSNYEAPVRKAALAGAVAHWLLAVPELIASGQEPLPEPAGILAAKALDLLAQARQTDFSAARYALRPYWQARVLLKRATFAPERVARGRLALSPFHARALLMGKALVGGW